MSKKHYTDYVSHCMRFYASYPKPHFRNAVDEQNWRACEKALQGFESEDRETLVDIYRGGDTLPDNVYAVAKTKGINQDSIWRQIDELEKKVAEYRGLL